MEFHNINKTILKIELVNKTKIGDDLFYNCKLFYYDEIYMIEIKHYKNGRLNELNNKNEKWNVFTINITEIVKGKLISEVFHAINFLEYALEFNMINF